MYQAHRKTKTATEGVLPADCFVEKTKTWSGTLIILLVGAIVYAVVTSIEHNPNPNPPPPCHYCILYAECYVAKYSVSTLPLLSRVS